MNDDEKGVIGLTGILDSLSAQEEFNIRALAEQKYFILKDKKPIPASLEEWAIFFENIANRIVKQEYVGNFLVSTTFLGYDAFAFQDSLPLIFETMVFYAGSDKKKTQELYFERYSTWEEAEQGHKRAVEEYKRRG